AADRAGPELVHHRERRLQRQAELGGDLEVGDRGDAALDGLARQAEVDGEEGAGDLLVHLVRVVYRLAPVGGAPGAADGGPLLQGRRGAEPRHDLLVVDPQALGRDQVAAGEV